MIRTGKAYDVILDWLFPPRCLMCGEFMEVHVFQPTCVSCSAFLIPFRSGKVDYHMIRDHLDGRVNIEQAWSLYAFLPKGNIQKLIHHIKYGSNRYLALYLGRQLGKLIDNCDHAPFDVIIPVPIHWTRYLKRGFNQSYWLAKGIAEILHCPIDRGSVRRVRATVTQTGKSRWERASSISGAIQGQERLKQYENILVVDDVITTGSTLEHTIQAIHDHSTAKIHVAVSAMGGL